jgi:hypothetical protein
MSIEDKNEEVLIEVPENTEDNETSQDLSGLSTEELEIAKKHGLIEEKEDVKAEDDKADGEDKKEEKPEDDDTVLDPDSFEAMDKVLEEDKDKFHKKFTPNAKALYFKHKKERNERQRIAKELENVLAEKELSAVKESANKAKVNKIADALKKENVTVEDLLKIIGDETAEPTEEVKRAEESKKNIEAEKQRQYRQRMELAEQIGKSKYEDFDKIADLAKEVAEKNPRFMKSLGEVFLDNNIDEEGIVEEVLFIAQRNPKFKDIAKKVDPKSKEEVSRAIKNSNKKPSTASLGSTGKANLKSEDSLTPEDVVNFSTQKWMSLSKKTRDRLLMEAS